MIDHDVDKKNMTDSPCIRNCCLDEEDICLGCFRHINEIVAWRSYSREEKKRIITVCIERSDNKKLGEFE